MTAINSAPTIAQNSPQMADAPYVDNSSAFPSPTDPKRVLQQNTAPGFINNRALGNIITSSATGLGNALFVSALIPNGTSGTFNLTVSNNQNQVILAVPDVSVYIGGQPSAASQWPTALVGGGNLPVYVMNDFGQTNNIDVVTRVVIRNNTGFDQQITVACRWRIITNSSGQLQNQTIS